MNFEALAADFWRDGYLVLDNVFDHALMDEYQRLIIEHFGETPEFLHNCAPSKHEEPKDLIH
jgi:hypothetical protein